MNGAARAIERQSERYRSARERWGVRPAYKGDGVTPYPINTHRPRYNIRAQDPLARRPGPAAMAQVYNDKSKPLDKDRRILPDGSISALCLWVGDLINALNPGQTVREAIPRSTVCYWIEILQRLHIIERWDPARNAPAAPRFRGDGRHKTSWIVNSYNRALDLIAADLAVATPLNRTFWTLDGKPMSTEAVVAWKLDEAVAKRMPEAWENNARFYDPEAPIKPLRRTERQKRPATQDEIDLIHNKVVGDLGIAATRAQTEEILRWGREKHEIPAGALAAALESAVHAQVTFDRKRRQSSVFVIGYFSRIKVQGLAERWHSNEMQRKAEQARADREASEATRTTGTDPPFPIPAAKKL